MVLLTFLCPGALVAELLENRNRRYFHPGRTDGLWSLCSRLLLAGIFIYASLDKIFDPTAFAEVIYNYLILPDYLINLTALVLPWLELILGLFLLIGLFREGSVVIVTGLLVLFLSAVIFNLARGLDIYCGCFPTSKDETNGAPMVWYAIRDGLLLILAFYPCYCTFRDSRREIRS